VGAEDSSAGENLSSPEGTGHSARLHSFRDYYSQEEIRPGDLVSTLWAYQPRARDEFELERGDMLKVSGIWDDGWATGVRVRGRAEEWHEGRRSRDSGVSRGSSGDSSPASNDDDDGGAVKAFPLVCVCVPRHWQKMIDGEATEDETVRSLDMPPSP